MTGRKIQVAIDTPANTTGIEKTIRALRRLNESYRKIQQTLARGRGQHAMHARPALAAAAGVYGVGAAGAPPPRPPRGGVLPPSGPIPDPRPLTQEMKKFDSATRRAHLSVGHLLKILVFYSVTGSIVRGFRALVSSAIEYGRAMESAQVSVAALTTAAGKMVDTAGNILPPAQMFESSMGEAQRQLEMLRKETLLTSMSFEDLAQAMQVGIAPGLIGGMSLDEIRLLTRRIAQAATTLRMPGSQLPEEIRSLLQGTIRPQTTRIATVLGITNEEVKRWKELGTLAEELFNRFDAFAQAEGVLAQTFEGLLGRLKASLGFVVGEAGKGFYDELKALLQDLLNMVTVPGEGGLVPDPSVIQAVSSMFGGLRTIIKEIRDWFKEVDLKAIADFGEKFSSTLVAGARSLVVIIQEFLFAINTVFSAFRALTEVLGGDATKFLTLWVTRILMFSAIIGRTVGVVKFLVGGLASVATTMIKIGKSAYIFKAGLAAAGAAAVKLGAIMAGAFAVAATAARAMAGHITGFQEDTLTWAQATKAHVLAIFSRQAAQDYIEGVMRARDEAENLASGVAKAGDQTSRASKESKIFGAEIAKIPPVMIALGQTFEDLADVLDRMEQSSRNSARMFDIMRTHVAASGPALDLQNRLMEAQVKIQEQMEGIDKDRQQRVQRIQAIENRRMQILREMGQADIETRDNYRELVNLQQELDHRTVGIASIKEKQAELEGKITREGWEGNKAWEARDELYGMAIDNYRRIAEIQEQLGDAEMRANIRATEGAAETIELTRQRAGENRELIEIDKQRLDILNKQREELSNALAVEYERARQALASEDRNQAQVEYQERILALQRAGAHNAVIEREQAEARLQAVIHQLDRSREQLATDLKVLEARKDALPEGRERASLEALIEELKAKQLHTERELQTELGKANEELRERERILSGTITEGLGEGMVSWAQEVPTAFQSGIDLMKSSLTQFSDLVSDVITDAFDPTTDTSLKERIGNFLRDIGRQIMQMVLRLAMAKAIASAFGVPMAAPTPAVDGMAKGGKVKGYAGGGNIRPAGVPASDTVPIWATPGEFMMRVDAVRRYGSDVMDAINRGLIDPMSLRGLRHAHNNSLGHSGRLGYAEGGEVAPGHTVPVASQSGPIAAYVVANDEAVDRILAGGKGAMLKFFKDNASTLKGLLR